MTDRHHSYVCGVLDPASRSIDLVCIWQSPEVRDHAARLIRRVSSEHPRQDLIRKIAQ